MPLARMLTSILPFVAVATAGVLLARDVTNTATVTLPGSAVDRDTSNNSATLVTDVLAAIAATDDSASDINGSTGAADVLNVFDNDTLDEAAASPANAGLSIPPGATLPAGITFDLATGAVGVSAGTPEGQYSFDYQICETAAPDNCEIASVTLDVVRTLGELAGTVFLDLDGDRDLSAQEPVLSGWTVEVLSGETLVESATTGADGSYTFPGLPGGAEYAIRFRDPETGVVFEEITGIRLEDGQTLPDQNLPIDPSGIIYDAVTRAPVAGATATLVDANGTALPEDCYIDESQSDQVTGSSGAYRFDIVPGADAACPVSETSYTILITPPAGSSFSSTILPPQGNSLDPTGRGSPLRVSTTPTAPTGGDPVYFIAFELEAGDPDIINNHIPIDPFLSRNELIVTKTSTRRSASTGDLVPYTITVRNDEAFRRADVDVVDVLPSGLAYVDGTARVNGTPVEPSPGNANRELVWEDQIIPASGSVTYDLVLVVGSGITEGRAINTAVAEDGATGSSISNRGTAVVSIVPSTLFDCSELIGQVFEDSDRDGYQDEGEPGIPAVRLATVNGELITTDEFGRYHIACAAVPDARIGSNFVLRLDEETLPQGWAATTDNPRSIRLTRGKMGELNFGAVQVETKSFVLDASSFAEDGSISPEFRARLLEEANSQDRKPIIRATYRIAPSDSENEVAERLSAIRDALRAAFGDRRNGHDALISVDAIRAVDGEGEE
ncbi:DUF11 domain-containing protein [Erythrobacter ani]|uniref:DUF11 domain-containing protein n=1 Tax=Erythrobacter ani TaxID=2827235 RepID=A0ABS6SKG2_9SPHN|nr:DUF11 domain-containing protein [Erythrobacter ani]MBV7264997.1 DUF11 domain-containing protein [Erythrobacter ani]